MNGIQEVMGSNPTISIKNLYFTRLFGLLVLITLSSNYLKAREEILVHMTQIRTQNSFCVLLFYRKFLQKRFDAGGEACRQASYI